MATELTPEQREAFAKALYAGRKIDAIKQLRELSGLGLKESKEIIERLESELRATHPERFLDPRTKSKSCLLLLILFFPVLVLIWFFIWRQR
jgi:hypothetical protein